MKNLSVVSGVCERGDGGKRLFAGGRRISD
jgi:hypothetical protein